MAEPRRGRNVNAQPNDAPDHIERPRRTSQLRKDVQRAEPGFLRTFFDGQVCADQTRARQPAVA
jgi:hypothetical protein